MRVLVVEDDKDIAALIMKTLSDAKISVVHIANGSSASTTLDRARRSKLNFDAIVLDLTLPGMDGMDVLKRLRNNGDNTPTLILTARGGLTDRLGGLESGADDYLTKPFAPEEMLARVRTIAKRIQVSREAPKECGNVVFDAAKGIYLVNGQPLVLPVKVMAVLDVLFKRRGEPVHIDKLLGPEMEDVDDARVVLKNRVTRLRDILTKAGANVSIKAVYGIGYQLDLVEKQG